MTARYFTSTIANDAVATLTDGEAHHFLHVMRGKVDDLITLFDGNGNEFAAQVTAVSRRDVTVQVIERRERPLDLPVPLHLAVAIPKGDRARWLVEKLTELGATSLTPLITQRGESQPSGKAIEKLTRYSIEACKQCGRNRLLGISEPMALDAFTQWLAGNHAELPAPLRLVAHPYGEAVTPTALLQQAIAADRPVAIAIGPEGGFSETEVAELASLGWQSVTLGERILRIETAALALAAAAALMAES